MRYAKISFYGALGAIFALAALPDSTMLPELFSISDEINHFAVFFTLSVLLDFAYPAARSKNKIIMLGLYGLAIETVQYFLPHREFSLVDLLADAASIALYFALGKAGMHQLIQKMRMS